MEEFFEKIRHTDENSNEYWMARELAIVIGYKDFMSYYIGKIVTTS